MIVLACLEDRLRDLPLGLRLLLEVVEAREDLGHSVNVRDYLLYGVYDWNERRTPQIRTPRLDRHLRGRHPPRQSSSPMEVSACPHSPSPRSQQRSPLASDPSSSESLVVTIAL